MSQYSHGFALFEFGILAGQCMNSVERGVSTPQQAVDFLAVKMRSLNLSHKEKVWFSNRIWKGIQRAEQSVLERRSEVDGGFGVPAFLETQAPDEDEFKDYSFVDTGEPPVPVKPDREASQNQEA